MAVTDMNVAASGGGSIPCLAAMPTGKSCTGVVVVPTIFGLNNDMTMVLERLAGEGFAAIVPNPFWRDRDSGILSHEGEERARAFARLERTPFDQALGDVTDVIGDLRSRPDGNGKVAVMGFCYGGPFALVGAARCGIQAGISYHGSFVEKYLDAVPDVRCPLSFHWGDDDRVAPVPVIDEIKQSLSAHDDAEVFLYTGGIAHGYMLPGHGQAYNEAAAELSWERTFRLLNAI